MIFYNVLMHYNIIFSNEFFSNEITTGKPKGKIFLYKEKSGYNAVLY